MMLSLKSFSDDSNTYVIPGLMSVCFLIQVEIFRVLGMMSDFSVEI